MNKLGKRKIFSLTPLVAIAQLVERSPVEGLVRGSSPLGDPMSYQSRKRKKSKLNRLKFLIGLALVKVLNKFKNKPKRKKEDKKMPRVEGMTEEVIDRAVEIIKRYDRLPNNPDTLPFIKKMIFGQLKEDGLLRLCVFVCPKFKIKALASRQPEKYMPAEAGPGDLFEQRISKIKSLRKDLMQIGLPTEVNLLIGDNDAEEYIFPFMESLSLDMKLFRQRQKMYRIAFEERARVLFGENYSVWSLAENSVSAKDGRREPEISEKAMLKEIKFFKWLFSKEGPYEDSLSFSEDILRKMVRIKYAFYGAQGYFLEELLGGILLQTEGPGVWLERTMMLRCTGAKAIPAIYPWIRQEELGGRGF